MRFKSIVLVITIFTFSIISCKNTEGKSETTKTKTEVATIAKMETISLNISGMTCEIGCAKTIQSKLSKKEGVASAKVVFTDSIATINFDANKTSTEDLTAFINGIAGGDLYKASKIAIEK